MKKESVPLEGPENEVEYYIYNGLGLDILGEYHDSYTRNGKPNPAGKPDQVIEYYYGNGMLLASKKLNDPSNRRWDKDPLKEVSFYHQDVLGSMVLITGKDGHVDERYQYDIWGKVYAGSLKDDFPGSGQKNNVYGFTGQRYQPELGVYSFRFRDYNSRTMRWMTEDPVKDGTNWYQYCGNDPVNYYDPLGLEVYVGSTHPSPEISTPSKSTPEIGIIPSFTIPSIPIVPESNHTFILITDKPIDQADPSKSIVLEAGPSIPPGYGTLEIQRYNDPKDVIADPGKYNLQEVPTPNGLSLNEFQNGIKDTFDSYDNVSHPPYFGLPDLDPTGNCRNSNSFVGSILRENGSEWKPDYWAPGWDLQVNFCSGN